MIERISHTADWAARSRRVRRCRLGMRALLAVYLRRDILQYDLDLLRTGGGFV
jgi:hypothetical protein